MNVTLIVGGKMLMALRCHGCWNALVLSMSCMRIFCPSQATYMQGCHGANKDAMVQTEPCSKVKAVWGIGTGWQESKQHILLLCSGEVKGFNAVQ